jgi:cyclopropane fatty-acyl-phospholipid synthase-like methyltransferase
MTLNDKQDCIESIVHALNRSEVWRTKLMVKYPADTGNLRAAKMLKQLAVDAASMTDEQWKKLEPHFCWSSGIWRNGLSEAARQVGFGHRARDFHSFVNALVLHVAQPSVAA